MNTEALTGKLGTWKSCGVARVHDVQRSLAERSSVAKHSVQESMRTQPMLWAGIAAGTGFGLGLIGRFVHWRNRRRASAPALIVIESSC